MSLSRKIALIAVLCAPFAAHALCVDSVVMVHGNTGTPSQWNNTYNLLISKGYTAAQIIRPDWGYKSALKASLNSHDATNTGKVKTAISSACLLYTSFLALPLFPLQWRTKSGFNGGDSRQAMTFRHNRHAMVLEVIRLSSQISTMAVSYTHLDVYKRQMRN